MARGVSGSVRGLTAPHAAGFAACPRPYASRRAFLNDAEAMVLCRLAEVDFLRVRTAGGAATSLALTTRELSPLTSLANVASTACTGYRSRTWGRCLPCALHR